MRSKGKAARREPGDDQPDRETQQAELAATEPSFDFKVENRHDRADVEKSARGDDQLLPDGPGVPVQQQPVRHAGLRALLDHQADAAPRCRRCRTGKDTLDLPLPAEFAKANVLVEILGAGQRKAQAYHANTLKLTLAENYGRLELRDSGRGQAGEQGLRESLCAPAATGRCASSRTATRTCAGSSTTRA